MKPIVIANFKEYLSPKQSVLAVQTIRRSLGRSKKFTGIVCPSPTALTGVAKALKGSFILFGAQRFDVTSSEAATGVIALRDIQTLGCKYVIVGHSEQRAAGETDALIAKKLALLSSTAIVPILCIGEPLSVRKRGGAARYVHTQLQKDLAIWKGKKILIAYEPIWAIHGHGKNLPCPPQEAFRMAAVLRSGLRKQGFPPKASPLLYGGSVSSVSVADYVDGTSFVGVLVGHASCKPSEYVRMVQKVL